MSNLIAILFSIVDKVAFLPRFFEQERTKYIGMSWLDERDGIKKMIGSIYWYLRKWNFIFTFISFTASGYFMSGSGIYYYVCECVFFSIEIIIFYSSSSFPFLVPAIEFDCLHCGWRAMYKGRIDWNHTHTHTKLNENH